MQYCFSTLLWPKSAYWVLLLTLNSFLSIKVKQSIVATTTSSSWKAIDSISNNTAAIILLGKVAVRNFYELILKHIVEPDAFLMNKEDCFVDIVEHANSIIIFQEECTVFLNQVINALTYHWRIRNHKQTVLMLRLKALWLTLRLMNNRFVKAFQDEKVSSNLQSVM